MEEKDDQETLVPEQHAPPHSTNQNSTESQVTAISSHKQEELDEQLQERVTTPQSTEPSPHAIATSILPCRCFALVVAVNTHKHLPKLPSKTKEEATRLFHALTGSQCAQFSYRGSKLLLNPSVVEFRETMTELTSIYNEKANLQSTFFLFLLSHGVRVSSEINKGSYILFSNSRLTSEAELLLTAVSEQELAGYIRQVPCKNKLVALDICHLHIPQDHPQALDETIEPRVLDDFGLILRQELRPEEFVDAKPSKEVAHEQRRQNEAVLVEACDIGSGEVSLRNAQGQVSSFLSRFVDAFRGAASPLLLDKENHEQTSSFIASDIIRYVLNHVKQDAIDQSKKIRDAYMKQVKNKFEAAAVDDAIFQTPKLHGRDHEICFYLGHLPAPPSSAPSTPALITSTLSSLSVGWTCPPNTGSSLPSILGYEAQYRGAGRAAVKADIWKRAGAYRVLSLDEVERKEVIPLTTTVANGLPTDTGYCFRVRAYSAGGWGPFSEISPAFRTVAITSVQDQLSTVQQTASEFGPTGLLQLMLKHAHVRSIQQLSIDELAKMALWNNRNELLDLPSTSLQPIVGQVHAAMLKFKHDYFLHRSAALFVGRLAISSSLWKQQFKVSNHQPSMLSTLECAAERFRKCDAQALQWISWAIQILRSEQ